MKRLREDAYVKLAYTDDTPYGSGVTGLFDALLHRCCAALQGVVDDKGLAGLEAEAETWMPRIMAPRALGGLYDAPDRLKEDCVHPPADAVNPSALHVALGNGANASLPLRRPHALAGWLGEWQAGAARPREPDAASLWDALDDLGAFEPVRPPVQPCRDGVTLVGHATVAMQHAGTQIVFDPFLVPPSPTDPAGSRPPTACDVRPDAVFITHSHPDHFDLSTLLRLGADVKIVVPEVERESLLATDMRRRLLELGFTDVVTARWYDEVHVGPFRVIALPFFGEQPTDGEMLHPEARNAGNTYVAEVAGRRVGLLADAGSDAAGSTPTLAATARERYGALDLLFGGYRAWRIQPIRYLFSSVARYLLFVPPHERTRWQQIMNDADDLVQTAHAWGARTVVPYANGGAPWFARIGLGPGGESAEDDNPRIDPRVETVDEAFARAPMVDARPLRLDAGERISLAELKGNAA